MSWLEESGGGSSNGTARERRGDEVSDAAPPIGLSVDRMPMRGRRSGAVWAWGAATLAGAASTVAVFLKPELLPFAAGAQGTTLWMATAIPGVLTLGALSGLARSLIGGGEEGEADPAANLLMAAVAVDGAAWFVTDRDGAVTYGNMAFEKLFPGGRTAEGVARTGSLDDIADRLVAGDDGQAEFRRLREMVATGRPVTGEIAIRARTGRDDWRHLSAQPLPSNGPHAGLVLWRAEDVSARRRGEGIQAAEMAEIRDLLDNLPVGLFSIGADGRFRYVNRLFADWLGTTPEGLRLLPEGLGAFIPEDAGPGRAYGGEQGDGQHGETVLQSLRGERFGVYLHQSERDDVNGEFVYSRSVALRDLVPREAGSPVTATAGAEGGGEEGGFAFRHLREGQRWLFMDAPVGIALVNDQGEVLDCNRAFLKLIGLHREALVGRPLAERINREDQGEVASQLSKIVMGTIRAAHMDVRMPAAKARELTLSVYASRMEDANGEVIGAVLHFIDTTEQKQLEVQFTQSQKMQAVGQLAGGVAHDFNNLLTAMIGFCDLLLARRGPGDPDFQDIMQIKQNANRATNLVRQLLAFSRRQTLQPRLLDINDALSELSNLLRRLIGETIRLVMEPSRERALVRVDPGQFDQVVINLAVNARDAMPGGGVLTIRAKTLSLKEAVQRGHDLVPAGEYVVVDVADTGTGIAKENIGRIFEPFFSTKEVGQGTGLGLSTVYGIIRQTDGYIFVDSALGEGTTFSICLPRYWPETEQDQADVRQPESGSGVPLRARPEAAEESGDLTGAGTILLVEDEDAVRLFGTRALKNKGYHVLEASNGEDALDILQGLDTPLDMIISDVVMPGMDGQTLVRLVRQEIPSVKVILISGYAEDAIPEEIGKDPTIHFLPKPFSLKQLAAKVKKVMEE